MDKGAGGQSVDTQVENKKWNFAIIISQQKPFTSKWYPPIINPFSNSVEFNLLSSFPLQVPNSDFSSHQRPFQFNFFPKVTYTIYLSIFNIIF